MKTSSAKALLTMHNLAMDAATLNNSLVLAKVLTHKTYLSTSGSGEKKSYLIFTDAGSEFGKNAASGFHEFKTDTKFFDERFGDAYLLAVDALLKQAHNIFDSP